MICFFVSLLLLLLLSSSFSFVVIVNDVAISQAKETKMNDNKQNNKNIIKATEEIILKAEPEATIQKGEIAPANLNVMKV